MSTRVSIGKAKPQLCDLVEQARAGKIHVITVHNKPFAQLGPVKTDSFRLTQEWRQRVNRIRLNRKGRKRLTVSQLIAVAKSRGLDSFTRDHAITRRGPKAGVGIKP